EIEGENPFKVNAYRRAAENISNLGRSLRDVWQEGELESIPGIGQALAKKLDELLRTGRLEMYERLQERVPPDLLEVLRVPGIGPRRARQFWQELDITNLQALKEVAEAGRLRRLPGMGVRSEQRILEGIAALERQRSGRIPLGVAHPLALQLLDALREAVPGMARAEVAGSVRRWRETIGDLDLLVAAPETDAPRIMDAFVRLPQVTSVLLTGPTKTSVRLKAGTYELQADLRVLPPARWGTALQYFTGSKAHNIELRERALKMGYSLSEHALAPVEGEPERLFDNEEALYAALGLTWIPPELREAAGEIEAAEAGTLPRLLELADIQGELHAHTTWSDGRLSVAEMADAARSRGYRYFAITEHSQGLGVTGGMNVEQLRAQRGEIEAYNRLTGDAFRLLHGIEVEVRADGTLDYPNDVLAELDVVVAGLHSGLRQDRQKITQRVLTALRNPHVDILAHPSGRLLGEREASQVDMDLVLRTAAETGTILEINAHPARLDLDAPHIRRACELGVKLVVNCDAHSAEELDYLIYGVGTARRGWATPVNVVNTWPLEQLLAYLSERE
ncbi:MAG TPA: DNA polymerase/3'-5' exonuclease PolX, partial [Anaerolineae bacterium]|nr:DNA polymerase/3'-5' exonuclease PolX [Anaerolineae bacterium]